MTKVSNKYQAVIDLSNITGTLNAKHVSNKSTIFKRIMINYYKLKKMEKPKPNQPSQMTKKFDIKTSK